MLCVRSIANIFFLDSFVIIDYILNSVSGADRNYTKSHHSLKCTVYSGREVCDVTLWYGVSESTHVGGTLFVKYVFRR